MGDTSKLFDQSSIARVPANEQGPALLNAQVLARQFLEIAREFAPGSKCAPLQLVIGKFSGCDFGTRGNHSGRRERSALRGGGVEERDRVTRPQEPKRSRQSNDAGSHDHDVISYRVHAASVGVEE